MPLEGDLEGTRGEWEFDSEVAEHFEDMLDRSVPGYDQMRDVVTETAVHFAMAASSPSRQGTIVDLGSAHEEQANRLIRHMGAHLKYRGYDISAAMVERANNELTLGLPYASIELRDFVADPVVMPRDVTLLTLTLMFTPPELRQQIIDQIYEVTNPGGVLLVTEKMLGASGAIDSYLVETHHRMKIANGYSADEVAKKRAALSGVLVPERPSTIETTLQLAGFTTDLIWRHYNFGTWLAIKR